MTPPDSFDQDAVPLLDAVDLPLDSPDVAFSGSHQQRFASCETIFRAHFTTYYATTNDRYNGYRPVYRYGYDLGSDDRYRHAEWASVEQVARPLWEARNPTTWAQFQDIIRYAWQVGRSNGDDTYPPLRKAARNDIEGA